MNVLHEDNTQGKSADGGSQGWGKSGLGPITVGLQIVCSSAEQSCQCTDGCTDGGKLHLSMEIAADIFVSYLPLMFVSHK